MKYISVTGILSLLFLLNCSGQKMDLEAENKILKEKLQNFAEYMNTENSEAFLAQFTDDARLTRPDSTVFEGLDEIRQWTERFSTYDFELELGSDPGGIRIFPAGKGAFDKGVYHIKRTPKAGGETENESGWYRMFWRKDKEGNWKLSRLNWLNAPSYSEDPDAY
jgi:ketosteroid isomerase-like protein